MYLSAVIDPSVFNKYAVKSSEFIGNLGVFAKRINNNGILLFDDKGKMKSEIKSRINYLPQEVSYMWTEFLLSTYKNNKQIDIDINDIFEINEAHTIAKKFDVDIFLVGNVKYPDIDGIKVTEYQFGEVEKCIEDETNSVLNVNFQYDDSTDVNEICDVIQRCTKYSQSIKIYDKQIGKSIEGDVRKYQDGRAPHEPLSRFYDGIEYILDTWSKFYALSNKKRKVSIYTVYESSVGSGGRGREGKAIKFSQYDALCALNKYLKEKLAVKFPDIIFEIELHEDPFGKYHPRFLVTDYATVQVDRGFDFFFYRKGRHFKSNDYSLRRASYKRGYDKKTKVGII